MVVKEAMVEDGWVAAQTIHANHIHKDGARRASQRTQLLRVAMTHVFVPISNISKNGDRRPEDPKGLGKANLAATLG